MDLTAGYCPTRKDLEERGWILVRRLSSVTARLLKPAAVDPKAFNATNAECSHIRDEIAESLRGNLEDAKTDIKRWNRGSVWIDPSPEQCKALGIRYPKQVST